MPRAHAPRQRTSTPATPRQEALPTPRAPHSRSIQSLADSQGLGGGEMRENNACFFRLLVIPYVV